MIRPLVVAAAAWWLALPLVSQQASRLPELTADVERLLERLGKGEAVASRAMRLAARIGEDAAPVDQRASLLARLRTGLPDGAGGVIAYVALHEALLAYLAKDYRAMLQHAEAASRSTDEGVRTSALRSVFSAALYLGDVGKAWWALERLRAQRAAGAKASEAADRADDCKWVELLLRVGMLRAAGRALDELEGVAANDPRLLLLRLEELLATERFSEALVAARRLEAAVSTAQDRSRLRLSMAFAQLRSGAVAEGTRSLERMLEDPAVDADYLPRIRAERALVALQQQDPPGEIASWLGDAALAPLERLQEWPLVARARYDLYRHRRSALDQAELAALRDALAERFRFVLTQWRTMPEVSEGVAFLQWSARRELLVCLCLAEAALGGEVVGRCLQHALAADACGSMARQQVAGPVTAVEFRRLAVSPDGVLLWFLPAPHGSLVLVVSATGGELLELPSDAPLREWWRELRAAVVDERRLGGSWREPLAAITAPLEAWVFDSGLRDVFARHRRVTVLGRELLAGLPFEFLVAPGSGQRLGLSHALDYMPSAALARAARVIADGARVGLVGVAEPTAAIAARYPGSAVPGSAQVLADVARPLASETVELAPAAGVADLQRLMASTECLVVFAHGRRRHPEDAVDELASIRPLGIVLQDGFYGAERLVGPAQVPSLVVLASCGTARAGVDRGEDAQLFGNAWLAAGVDQVLAAEGDLQLAATADLLREFLAGLAAGAEPAEALRLARVIVAAQPGGAHPALHCGLRLDRAGLTVPRLRADAGRSWWWGLLGGAGLLVGCLVWRRRRNQPPVPSGSPSGGSSSGGGGGITGGSTVAPTPPKAL